MRLPRTGPVILSGDLFHARENFDKSLVPPFNVSRSETLASIDRPVDMVQVFRTPDELPQIAREAVAIGAKVLWGQLGVRNDEAARIAETAGLKVVMDRCPKIELFRPFWKPKLHLGI